jgi:hypothetical protein
MKKPPPSWLTRSGLLGCESEEREKVKKCISITWD